MKEMRRFLTAAVLLLALTAAAYADGQMDTTVAPPASPGQMDTTVAPATAQGQMGTTVAPDTTTSDIIIGTTEALVGVVLNSF
jgi:hypothetical protein